MTRPVHEPSGKALRAREERFRATFELGGSRHCPCGAGWPVSAYQLKIL